MRLRQLAEILCRNASCFERFSSVCPEPVLVKSSFLNTINGAKRRVSLPMHTERQGGFTVVPARIKPHNTQTNNTHTEKTSARFLSFESSARNFCPELVLANDIDAITHTHTHTHTHTNQKNGFRDRTGPVADLRQRGALRKTPLFSQLFLCLSRACLGKCSFLYINGAQNGVFRTM